jgi:retinol dehydrogenase-14
MQILITGGTNGIGLAAAQMLAAGGANVAIVGRNETRTQAASARIRAVAAAGVAVGTFIADLSTQAAVRKLAAEVRSRYPRLDVLVNNAGAMYTTRQLTADGIELTWAVNHLAPFLLTTLLLDRLEASAPARIITTASDAHRGALLPFEDLKCRAFLSELWTLRADEAGEHPVHARAGAPSRGQGRDRQLLPSRAGGERLQP